MGDDEMGQATSQEAPGAKKTHESSEVAVASTCRWVKVPDEEHPRSLLWEWRPSAPDDLDALFHRVAHGTASSDDHELFHASVIDRFISRVHSGKQIEPWILAFMADALFKVLMGGDWNDELQLPGRPPTEIRPWRDQRDLEIFCDVSNAINLQEMKVTEAIGWAAENHAVSFETARAGYYRWKEAISKKAEKP